MTTLSPPLLGSAADIPIGIQLFGALGGDVVLLPAPRAMAMETDR